MKYPQHRFSSCCYRKCLQGNSAFWCPIQVIWATSVQDTVVFLVCRFQWNGPKKDPMSGYFFSLTMYPQDNPKPSHNWDAEDTVVFKWSNSKKGAARNSSSRRLGDQVLFLSSSGPEGPLSIVYTRLGWAVRGPTWIWRLESHPQGMGQSRSKWGSFAGTSSPASSSPSQCSPLDPRFLRLQGRDGSPGHQGPREVSLTCLYFSF